MTRFRCIHCGEDTGTSDSRVCGRCAVLLAELGDSVVEPPREPGSDDVKPKSALNPRHNGKWLTWAANKRGCLRWFHTFGVQHDYPRNINLWSPAMVAMAVKAKQDDLKKVNS